MKEKTKAVIAKSFFAFTSMIIISNPLKVAAAPSLPDGCYKYYIPAGSGYEYDKKLFRLEDCFRYIYRDGKVIQLYNLENIIFVVDPDNYKVEKFLIQRKEVEILKGYYDGISPSPAMYVAQQRHYYIMYDFISGEELCSSCEEIPGINIYEEFKKNKICINGPDIGNYMQEYEKKSELTSSDIEEIEATLPYIVKEIEKFKRENAQYQKTYSTPHN